MQTELVNITPKVAKELLERNYADNRRIRKAYVRQLATVMKNGRFISQNGQTIVVGEDDGVLYDGQHRLTAIVASGCAQTMLVVKITGGKEAYKTIDNGSRRLASDFIDMPNKTASAALAKCMACVEWGKSPLLSCLQGRITTNDFIDRGLVVAYAEQHEPSIQHGVQNGMRLRNAIGGGPLYAYSFFVALVTYCRKDTYLGEFIDEFVKPASTNATIVATKTLLLKERASSKSKLDGKWILGTLLDAYHHFCEMDGSTTINKQLNRINAYSKLIEKQRETRGKE